DTSRIQTPKRIEKAIRTVVVRLVHDYQRAVKVQPVGDRPLHTANVLVSEIGLAVQIGRRYFLQSGDDIGRQVAEMFLQLLEKCIDIALAGVRHVQRLDRGHDDDARFSDVVGANGL